MMESSLLSYIPNIKFMDWIVQFTHSTDISIFEKYHRQNKIINVLEIDVCVWNGVFISI